MYEYNVMTRNDDFSLNIFYLVANLTSFYFTGCSVNQFYFPNAKQTINFVRYRSYFPQMFKAGTACLWVNPQTTSGFIPIASYAIGSQNNEWVIGIDNGKVSLYIHGPHTLLPVTVSINIWVFIILSLTV